MIQSECREMDRALRILVLEQLKRAIEKGDHDFLKLCGALSYSLKNDIENKDYTEDDRVWWKYSEAYARWYIGIDY